MFRKFFLKRKLRKLAILLIKRYGKNSYYTPGQLNTAVTLLGLGKADYRYYALLFLNEQDYRKKGGTSNYFPHRKSLYLYFYKDTKPWDIKNNNYHKLLHIEESTSCHSPIGPNNNVFAAGGTGYN